jgi:hypothetical protein
LFGKPINFGIGDINASEARQMAHNLGGNFRHKKAFSPVTEGLPKVYFT